MSLGIHNLLVLMMAALCSGDVTPGKVMQEEAKVVIKIGFDDQEEEEVEEEGDHDEEEEVEIELPSKIVINGKEIQIDEEKLELLIEENMKGFEAWAEEHAADWEKWAETFESKMEKWAQKTEKDWEKWADKYSDSWESWGEKLESGEIKPDELGALLEKNLEMLSDMPLGELIEGALENSLGELENAPFESLGELNELVGGALEQSLRALEADFEELEVLGAAIGGATHDLESRKKLSGAVAGKLNETLAKLQDSIAKKDAKLDAGAEEKLAALEDLLIREKDLDEDTRNAVLAALKTSLATKQKRESQAMLKDQKKLLALQKRAEEEIRRASEQQRKESVMQREEAFALAAAARASKEAALAKRKEKLQQKQLKQKSAKKSIEGIYSALKKQQEKLETKESEIEAMRREIRTLRKELQKIKKSDK